MPPDEAGETQGGDATDAGDGGDVSDFDLVAGVLDDAEGKPESPSAEGDDGDVRDDPAPTGDDGADDDPEPDPDPGDDDDVDDTAGEAVSEIRKAIKGKDFKKAFELLDVDPKDLDLDEKAWTSWRAANAREHKKLKASEQAAIQRLSGWDQNLRAQDADIQKKTQELEAREARAAPIVKAIEEYEKTGDPTHIVAIVERATGKAYDEAQKDILHKVRRSPGERRLQEQLEAVTKRLEEMQAGGQKPDEQQPPDPEAVAQKEIQWVTQNLDQAIAQGLVSKDAKAVPHAAQRIRNLMIKTKGPTGPTLTVDQAARQVLKAERARLQNHPLARVQKPKEAPAPRGKGKRNGAVLRRDSRNEGTGVRDGKDSNEDIIQSVLKRAAQQRTG